MADSSDEDLDIGLGSIFPEPPRPPTPEPTTAIYTRNEVTDAESWKELKIRLVGSHPLWAHHLWNAARSFASYLDVHRALYQNRAVLELGAGGGLPSLVAAKNGARLVVITDYPDAELVENMEYNVKSNLTSEEQEHVSVKGYVWGHPSHELLDATTDTDGQKGFDLIILSDLVFNHSQHDALLSTCESVLAQHSDSSEPPSVLVFYTHHRPHLAHRDMEFFSKARDRGWKTDKIVEERFPPMFPEDPGDEDVRSTVHGWQLTRLEV